MTNELVQSITAAEAQAAEIKESALLRAQEIVAAAEAQATEKEKTSANLCKSYKETQLKKVETEAQKSYEQSIRDQKLSAQKYAEEVLKSADVSGEIVRRIVSGSC